MTDMAEIRGIVLGHMITFGNRSNVDLLKAAQASGEDVAFTALPRFDSVDAVELCMELEARLGVAIDLAEFARVRTLNGFSERVAAIVGSGATEVPSSPAPVLGPNIMCLQPGEPGRMPLYLIAGGDGSTYGFRHIVAAMHESIPVYALKLRGIDGMAMPHLEAQEVAAFLASTVREFQPSGELVIMGYSMGGMLAFETACKLLSDGMTPAQVVMLDTNCQVRERSTRPATARLLESRFWSQVLGLKWFEGQLRDRRNLKSRKAQQAQFDAYAARGEAVPLNLRESYFNTASRIILSCYLPSRYAGPVTLFRSSRRHRRAKDDNATLGWQPHCERKIRVIAVDANHFDILEPRQAAQVAKNLAEMMAVPGAAELQSV